MVQTERYTRKPFFVDAVLVTEENFEEVAKWCKGTIAEQGDQRYIKVFVKYPKTERQTQAFVGDWILKLNGYKIYTQKAFEENFDPEVGEIKGYKVGDDIFHPGDVTIIRDGQVVVSPKLLTDQDQPVDREVTAQLAEADLVEVPNSDIAIEDSPTAPPVAPEPSVRVLSQADQINMTPLEVQRLVRSGEAVLEQDVA